MEPRIKGLFTLSVELSGAVTRISAYPHRWLYAPLHFLILFDVCDWRVEADTRRQYKFKWVVCLLARGLHHLREKAISVFPVFPGSTEAL